MNTQGKFVATWVASAAQNDGDPPVAIKAGVAGQRHFVTSVSVSASDAPASALEVFVESDTLLDEFYIPAAQFAPLIINYNAPLQCGIGEDVQISATTAGSGVTCSVVIRGFTLYQ